MESFNYIAGTLHCENTDIKAIIEKVGSPLYLYSKSSFEAHYNRLDNVLSKEKIRHLIAYAVKANSNLSIINIFAKLGAGADVVSGGEIYKALAGGIKPSKMVYAGVGKTAEEIKYALKSGIGQFNVESRSELKKINNIAASQGMTASIAIRVNPNVDPKTHPYISTGMKKYKFGIPLEQAFELYKDAESMKGIRIKGIHFHIGSQLTDLSVFNDAAKIIVEFLKKLKLSGIMLETIDIGGGIGIKYLNDEVINLDSYAEIAKRIVSVYPEALLICEPGRFMVGEGGALVTKILYIKDNGEKLFYIVDAAMTDLIRPTLYHAEHKIIPVTLKNGSGKVTVDVVGPVCESGDFLAKNISIDRMAEGNLIAVMSAGAYGFSMSSHYNARPNIAEVLVDKDQFSVIRRPETYKDLIKAEV